MATHSPKAAPKPLFSIAGPVPARVFRGRFKPFASTAYLSARALKLAEKAFIECGTLEVGGHSVTLVAEVRSGIITEIKPRGCDCCTPRKGKPAASTAQVKALQLAVNAELTRRKVEHPKWPIGTVARASLGFGIPIGPIIIIIGTFPGEGIDTFDICIVINSGDGKSCTYCLLRPTACIELGGPL